MSDERLSDIPYTWGFYGEMSPVFLNYVSAVNGFEPVPVADGFDYCELGCGQGVTLAVNAQLFVGGRFLGIDMSEAHIANAEALAAEAGLSNLSFRAADFSRLADLGLGQFDFIALHGVYSWIDPEARNNVREFIAAHLKPGGLVYVSYNAMPGWAALLPLREMVLSATLEMDMGTLAKAQAGLDYLSYLKDNDAAFFQDNPPAAAFVEEIKDLDIRYVAHEFFADFAKPYYFYQVAGEMRSAGLSFVGSTQLNLNFMDLAVPAEFHARLGKSATRNALEADGDYIRNQRFRRDVYINRHDMMEEADQTAVLAAIPCGTLRAVDDFKRSAEFGAVKLNYKGPVFDVLIRYLSAGARTPAELKDLADFKDYPLELLIDGIKFLAAGGQMLPFARNTEPAPGELLTAERYALGAPMNLAVLKRRLFQDGAIAMTAPAAGIGLEVAMSDAFLALCSAEAPADQVADWAFQRSIEAGQQIVSEDGDQAGALAEAVRAFRETRLPKFLELGILVPAPEDAG